MPADTRPKPYPSTGVLSPPPMIPAHNLQLTDVIPPEATSLDPCIDPCEADDFRQELQKQAREAQKQNRQRRRCKETENRFLQPRTDLWTCVNVKQNNCGVDPFSRSISSASHSPSPTGLEGLTDRDGCRLRTNNIDAISTATGVEPCLVGLRQVSMKMTETHKDCSKRDCDSKRNPPYENSSRRTDDSFQTSTTFSRSERGGRSRQSDNVSLATTDTQKLLAMLKEDDGLEGLSITSTLCNSLDQDTPCESVFDGPSRTRLTKRGVSIKVVKKKPSPTHLSRTERKYGTPCGLPPAPVPCSGPEPNADSRPDLGSLVWEKTICKKNAEKPRGPLGRSCKRTGYLEDHNADCLPPVAHLAHLGPPSRTCCIPNSDPCAPPDPAVECGQGKQSKPWKSVDTQNTQGRLNTAVRDGQRPMTAGGRGQKQGSRNCGPCGPPVDPCDIIAWQGGHKGHGNEEPMRLAASVFEQDMNQPQNVACRPAQMVTITKTAGDPALIKKAACGSAKGGKDCSAPSQMDAEELMSLEEDLNDEEQLQDSKKLAIYLSADLKDQFFTDVTVTSRDHIYKIHKEYLLAFTNYDIPVIEGQPLRDQPSLDLCEIDGSDVAAVLHFLYYGELKANIYNILGIMAAANALGVVDVPVVLKEYHDKLFAPPNQTNVIDFALCKQMGCLADYTWKLFVANFSEHVNGCHFLNWEVRWVLNLLSHEDIPIMTELEVFEAARLWINYRPEDRLDHIRAVLNCVRWTYMTAEEMVCCEREDPCLMNRSEAHELVADANWYKVMIQKGKKWHEFDIKPPRGAYASKHPVVVPPRPTAGCRVDSAGGGDGKCGPKVAYGCKSACPKSADQPKKNKCAPAKEKDACASRYPPKKEESDACGKIDKLKEDLARLPIPPESDLFSTISYCSLEMDIRTAACTDPSCKEDIMRF
ncbi:uncharacterized protein LOC129586879 [Paramacrobiotus metropolitanus]|uniref:uncharacterized protein LOC129586879 n=1 Tax=Paramacrobiotus metropolitanus TaxID=2943436 RepID=UPI002445D043|nr:uncharacterized protein LOC129586879 [Paramacrobiotus metropolitanus]